MIQSGLHSLRGPPEAVGLHAWPALGQSVYPSADDDLWLGVCPDVEQQEEPRGPPPRVGTLADTVQERADVLQPCPRTQPACEPLEEVGMSMHQKEHEPTVLLLGLHFRQRFGDQPPEVVGDGVGIQGAPDLTTEVGGVLGAEHEQERPGRRAQEGERRAGREVVRERLAPPHGAPHRHTVQQLLVAERERPRPGLDQHLDAQQALDEVRGPRERGARERQTPRRLQPVGDPVQGLHRHDPHPLRLLHHDVEKPVVQGVRPRGHVGHPGLDQLPEQTEVLGHAEVLAEGRVQ